MHIRIACENHRILILLAHFTYLLTYFNYSRSSSSRARKKLEPKLESKKSSTGTALNAAQTGALPGVLAGRRFYREERSNKCVKSVAQR